MYMYIKNPWWFPGFSVNVCDSLDHTPPVRLSLVIKGTRDDNNSSLEIIQFLSGEVIAHAYNCMSGRMRGRE